MPAKPAAPDTAAPPVTDNLGDPIFVSVAEAARLLGLSRSQTYHLLADDTLECRYFGKRRLVVMDSVRRFASDLPNLRAG